MNIPIQQVVRELYQHYGLFDTDFLKKSLNVGKVSIFEAHEIYAKDMGLRTRSTRLCSLH